MNREDLCWLAGILEGEGCFDSKQNGRSKAGKVYRAARIRLRMTDKDVVDRVGALFDRTVSMSANGEHKIVYSTQLQGSAAIEMMKILKPMMGERRQRKIDELMIEFNPFMNS